MSETKDTKDTQLAVEAQSQSTEESRQTADEQMIQDAFDALLSDYMK